MALALVAGMGEIGEPIFRILTRTYGSSVKCIDLKKPGVDKYWPDQEFEYLHICFPQTIKFMSAILNYVLQYNVKIVIIHSTVTPGLVSDIGSITSSYFRSFLQEYMKKGNSAKAALDEWKKVHNKIKWFYSPVRANARDGMEWGLTTYTKYIAPADDYDQEVLEKVTKHLKDAGFPVKMISEVKSLEYAKLFNLAYYATCISVFQTIERIAENEDLSLEVINEFIVSTQKESIAGGKPILRPLYYGGFIGGHCVIPAVEKLLSLHDIPLFRAIIDSNIKRERELMFKDARQVDKFGSNQK